MVDSPTRKNPMNWFPHDVSLLQTAVWSGFYSCLRLPGWARAIVCRFRCQQGVTFWIQKSKRVGGGGEVKKANAVDPLNSYWNGYVWTSPQCENGSTSTCHVRLLLGSDWPGLKPVFMYYPPLLWCQKENVPKSPNNLNPLVSYLLFLKSWNHKCVCVWESHWNCTVILHGV